MKSINISLTKSQIVPSCFWFTVYIPSGIVGNFRSISVLSKDDVKLSKLLVSKNESFVHKLFCALRLLAIFFLT